MELPELLILFIIVTNKIILIAMIIINERHITKIVKKFFLYQKLYPFSVPFLCHQNSLVLMVVLYPFPFNYNK